mgnify:CR=1 FL=1
MFITELTLGKTYTFIGFKRNKNDTDLVEDNKNVDAFSNFFITYYNGKPFTLHHKDTDNYYYFKTNLVKTDGTLKLDNNDNPQEIEISLADPEHSYNGFKYKLIPIFEVLPELEPELETVQEPDTVPESGFEIKAPLQNFLLDVPVEQLN